MQMHTRRRLGAAHDVGDLAHRQLLLHVQDQHGALLRRQPCRGVPDTRERALASQALDGIRPRSRLLRERRRLIVARALLARKDLAPPAVLATMVETEIDEQPIEPRREPRPAAKTAGRFPEPD